MWFLPEKHLKDEKNNSTLTLKEKKSDIKWFPLSSSKLLNKN